jgi:GT2 family glycosyltransferase
MKVAVVILNWNGKALLDKYLPSVLKHSVGAEIVVVDNQSSDDSVSFIETQFPTITIIKHSQNFGYAEGYNQALKQLDADLFCLLNSDVRVTKNWLQPVITHFTNHPETSIAQPKILSDNQPNTFEYAGAAGGFIDQFGFPFCKGRIFQSLEKDTQQYNETASIFWASGACFFVRSKVFKELNGFDTDYFAHFEEIDFCWRAAHNQHQAVCVGTSSVYHLGGGTLPYKSSQKLYYNIRNSLFTLLKNLPLQLLFPVIVTRMIFDGFLGVFFLITLRPYLLFSIFRAHFSFHTSFGSIFKKRKFYNKTNQYFVVRSIIIQYFIFRRRFFNNLKIRVKKKLATSSKSE